MRKATKVLFQARNMGQTAGARAHGIFFHLHKIAIPIFEAKKGRKTRLT